jgi:hypothetical protein
MELEETALGIPGYRAFNVYLDRHIKMISDQAQLYRPLREDSEVLEEHLMQLPEGSEGLRSAASKEIDALLRMWEREKVRLDEENSAKSSDDESSKGLGHTLAFTER